MIKLYSKINCGLVPDIAQLLAYNADHWNHYATGKGIWAFILFCPSIVY